MPQTDFPPLRLAVLNGLLGLKDRYAADPDLFKHDDCPYDDETVSALRTIFEVREVERVVEKIVQAKRERGRPKKGVLGDEDLAELETELKDTYQKLKEMEAASGTDTSEKVQITRLKTTCLEKLLEMRERLMNVKRMSEFQTIVISILDDFVGQDDRDAFLDRLEEYM